MGKLKIFPISIRISERDLSVFTGVLLRQYEGRLVPGNHEAKDSDTTERVRLGVLV